MSPTPKPLIYSGRTLAFDRPVVMGILNVTPDSFSDGGQHASLSEAAAAADAMLQCGADIIDVGGESTRPGAEAVSLAEELDRTVALVEALVKAGALVSVDTSKAVVMRECLAAGAFMINDVCALQAEGALDVVAQSGAPVCLMHMLGEPRTMQQQPEYDDVIVDIIAFFTQRIQACEKAGIAPSQIMVDPGFGFGKTPEHNLCLLKELQIFAQLGHPVLVGLSRKSLFAAILGLAVDQRLHASVAAALLAVERGANIVRVHDVKATVDALGVYNAMRCV